MRSQASRAVNLALTVAGLDVVMYKVVEEPIAGIASRATTTNRCVDNVEAGEVGWNFDSPAIRSRNTLVTGQGTLEDVALPLDSFRRSVECHSRIADEP